MNAGRRWRSHKPIWRLMPLCDGTGAEQMAMDSWLLDQHAKGLQPPSLRFYTWRSPTISLGYHQRQFPDYWKSLAWPPPNLDRQPSGSPDRQPVELVRRPTGGRAVLHQGDLTYALVTSGFKGSRRHVYEQLCQFLIEGWCRLGVSLTFGTAGRGYIKNPNCFGTATAADLVMPDGYKFIGSAQVYREGCVLQHGSIRLNPDGRLFEQVFGETLSPPSFPPDLLALQGTDALDLITSALIEAACDCWGVEFDLMPLSRDEFAQATAAWQSSLTGKV